MVNSYMFSKEHSSEISPCDLHDCDDVDDIKEAESSDSKASFDD